MPSSTTAVFAHNREACCHSPAGVARTVSNWRRRGHRIWMLLLRSDRRPGEIDRARDAALDDVVAGLAVGGGDRIAQAGHRPRVGVNRIGQCVDRLAARVSVRSS